MSRSATQRSVRQVTRILKRMNFEPIGWEAYHEGGRAAIRAFLEDRLTRRVDEYLEQVRAQGPSDRRNGYYRRQLLTSMGAIELSIPRTRAWNPVGLLGAYARRSQDVDRAILAGFIFGLSTRKVAEALLPMLGERVSASTVSRVAKSLDQAVESFHRRRLTGRYRGLILDGVYLRRKTGVGVERGPVLVALGLLPDGRKEVIDFRQARSEGEGPWSQFLTNLLGRGLCKAGLESITIDGGSGLIAALENVFPDLPLQRCWAHKVRNVLEKAKRKDWAAMKRDLSAIVNAPSIGLARQAGARFVRRWKDRSPNAVRCLQKDFEGLLVFFRYEDPEWRKRVRTTNAIERRFREVRRRTRPMGVMSDQTSIERILFSVFTHENRKAGTAGPFPLLTQNS